MKVPTKRFGIREFFAVAYAPRNNPKRAMPGPLFDISVVGLFLFLAVGYALS